MRVKLSGNSTDLTIFSEYVLDHTLLLIVPNKDRIGNTIDPRSVIETLYKEICKNFTGLREWQEKGVWISAEGNVILEDNTVLKISFQKDQVKEIDHLITILYDFAASTLNQETIAVELDGNLVLIPVRQKTIDDTDSSQ